jgi:hypothetical protein
MVNSGPQNAVARVVNSSLALARSTASSRIRGWSKASSSLISETGAQRALLASDPAAGTGRSGARAR